MLNTFCPGSGSNQDLLRGSQTFYRVAIKAGLYRKAVQVCIILTLPHLSNIRCLAYRFSIVYLFETVALFGVLPTVPLVILPMVLPMVPLV